MVCKAIEFDAVDVLWRIIFSSIVWASYTKLSTFFIFLFFYFKSFHMEILENHI